jgi:hypothetical protein
VTAWHLSDDKDAKSFMRKIAISYPASSIINPSFAASGEFRSITDGCDWDLNMRANVYAKFPALHQLITQKRLKCVPNSSLGVFLSKMALQISPWDGTQVDICKTYGQL